MKVPPLVSKLVPRHPDGRVAVEGLWLISLVAAMTAFTVTFEVKAETHNLVGFFWDLAGVVVLLTLVILLGRVTRLERCQKVQTEALQAAVEQARALQQAAVDRPQPGTLEFMVLDAKAAGRAVGYNLAKQEEVAQTVLTACLRKGGTFEA